MCCRTTITPLVPEIARAVLAAGLFVPVYQDTNWERKVEEEESDWITVVHATVRHIDAIEASLELNLAPAISVFSQHHGKRRGAGVVFEMAARYAEKVGGTVVQRAVVAGCESGKSRDLVIAAYPHMPLDFSRVCPGFRAEILGRHHHEEA